MYEITRTRQQRDKEHNHNLGILCSCKYQCVTPFIESAPFDSQQYLVQSIVFSFAELNKCAL